MNQVDAHFKSSDCGMLFTTPTLITSDELLEGYSSSNPENATLRSSWHNLIDMCQTQNSLIYLRLVYPEITLGGDRKTREHLKKFRQLYKHLTKFSGVEIDLTNGLLSSVCQNGSSLQKQEDYINSIIQQITETTNLSISIRLSCLQHIHIISSRLLYSDKVSLVHLVDVKQSFIKHSSMLGLFSYYNGSDPPLSAVNVHHDLLLYRMNSIPNQQQKLKSPILEKRYTDPLLPQLRHRSPIRRNGSPMKRRKTGFQDEIEPFNDNTPSMPQDDDDLAHKIAAWGWSILIFVWVGFILGVGSIFGLWPPFAPAPTAPSGGDYPIPTYYPNLIVLLGVVAWVWCIVSWMGMKFFRHARIDD